MQNRSASVTPLPPRRAVRTRPVNARFPCCTNTLPSAAVLAAAILITALFAGCSSHVTRDTGDHAPREPVDISGIPDAVPRNEPLSRYGNPVSYVVFGHRYYTLKSRTGYHERGIASWYGTKFHGQRTSSGEVYDLYKMTAAHKTLPLPTYARVTNLKNGRSIVVKINDRGPFHPNRIIDLSYVAAAKLGILATGTGLVEVDAIDPSKPPEPTRTAPKPVLHQASSLFLQVGAFKNRDNAVRLSGKLQKINIGTIHIVEAASASGPIYRVRIGPLQSVDEADRISSSLTLQGFGDTTVVIN